MATSKHVRKTGATTVTKDGVIIGNIGKGKTNIPTSQPVLSSSDKTAEQKLTSHIEQVQTKFLKLQEQNIQTTNDPGPAIDYDKTITLWNLTQGQPFATRLDVVANVFSQLSDGDKKQFFDTCLQTDWEYDKAKRKQCYDVHYDTLDALEEGKQLTAQTCDMLAQHPERTIREAALTHPNVSTETLLSCANDPQLQVRKQVAKLLPMTYTAEIKRLITENNESIHITLLDRTDLTDEMISEIYTVNSSTYMLIHLAAREDTPPHVLEAIYEDEKNVSTTNAWRKETLINIADNPNTPQHILAEMTEVSRPVWGDDYIARRAKINLAVQTVLYYDSQTHTSPTEVIGNGNV